VLPAGDQWCAPPAACDVLSAGACLLMLPSLIKGAANGIGGVMGGGVLVDDLAAALPSDPEPVS